MAWLPPQGCTFFFLPLGWSPREILGLLEVGTLVDASKPLHWLNSGPSASILVSPKVGRG